MAGRFAIFSLLLSVFQVEGIRFQHTKYVFVLTPVTDRGPVGKIRAIESTSDITYELKGTELLRVDNSGKLHLLKQLYSAVEDEFSNKEFVLTATETNGEKASTIVIILVLPIYHGDKFVPRVNIKKESSSVKGNRFKNINSILLLHFLRRPSKTSEDIAKARLRLEAKIEKIKKMIFQEIAAKYGSDVLVLLYVHLKELFSEKVMEEMDEEAECIEPVIANCSSRKSRFSSIDGTCNNKCRPTEGASDTGFIRLLPALYFDVDGLNDPIGYPNQPNAPLVPSPHSVSRNFIKDEVLASSRQLPLTHLLMQFGQFIDHDLDLAVEVEFEEENICLNVPCDGSPADFTCPCYPILPDGDARCIRVTRSAAVCQKHGYPKPREQINVNTAPIDASQVYGSTQRVADELRETDPDLGLLKSSTGPDGELLPLDPSLESEEQLCNNLGGCFIAGDSRSNEQQSLAAFHTLFLREHNRIARVLKQINDHWDGERVYQETRRIMGAVMQKITYEDFLPAVLGPDALPKYKGYKPDVNLGISNAFATAAFRFGHSLIRPSFDILNENFDPIGDPIDLRLMFFNNTFIQRNGIRPILLGLIGNFSEKVDRTLSSGLTQHLFERENSPGSNLAALNIQRHRDHGLPGYNDFRKFCGLQNAETFDDTANEITDPLNRQILEDLYGNPDHVELWVAGLAETPFKEGIVGRSFHCIIKDQFQRTRDGDRFYYERKGVWTPSRRAEIRKASLSRMYCDNLDDVISIQRNAFKAGNRITCGRIPNINLCEWKESEFFRRPCAYGRPAVVNETCTCKCRSSWQGGRCDTLKLRRSLPWHAEILNADREIVCSGALVSSNCIMTTFSCARRAFTNSLGFVKLPFAAGFLRIRRWNKWRKNNDLVCIRPRTRVRTSVVRYPIRRAPLRSTQAGFVSAAGSTDLFLVRSTVSRSRKVCNNVFQQFNTTRDVCTLPAGLPSTTISLGSPLVQYRPSRRVLGRYYPRLVGLLTDDVESSSSGLRFGKYTKTW